MLRAMSTGASPAPPVRPYHVPRIAGGIVAALHRVGRGGGPEGAVEDIGELPRSVREAQEQGMFFWGPPHCEPVLRPPEQTPRIIRATSCKL